MVTDVIRCSRCDQELPPEAFWPSQRAQGGWCRSCRQAYMVEYKRQHPAPLQPCRDCGRKYERWNGHWKEPTSGGAYRRCRDCYLAHWREQWRRRTGSEYQRRSSPPDPSTLTVKQMRNDARMDRLRARVLSEETHCGICGEHVDKTLDHRHKMSATVDHIIPLAFGGAPFDRHNVRLAHRSCNCIAGNKQRETMIVERLVFARAATWLGRFF
jgi:5-methylcytosine-specific restriction endonuclease McrA